MRITIFNSFFIRSVCRWNIRIEPTDYESDSTLINVSVSGKNGYILIAVILIVLNVPLAHGCMPQISEDAVNVVTTTPTPTTTTTTATTTTTTTSPPAAYY
uniref:Uncharacterized protein n=1 Tax=Panagrellus redivivus TaxID=6233 RepID=A0A7E4W521_PANRE